MDSGDPYGPWQGTLHPRDKQTLGQRLSLVARALTYGEAALTFEGPRMAAVAVALLAQTNAEHCLWRRRESGLVRVCVWGTGSQVGVLMLLSPIDGS